MDNNIKVVIIDNGLNQKLYHELTGKYAKSYKIQDKTCVLEGDDTHLYGINHGTVCAALLGEFTGDIELLSISVNEEGNLPVKNLETALIWCINNQVNVICMSIGITRLVEITRMLPLFHMLAMKGRFVIAADSNNGLITYPAALSTVIGVRYVNRGNNISIIKNPMDGIDIEADMPQSNILRKLKADYNFIPPITNSIVTPYVTSKIIQFIRTMRIDFISLEDFKYCFGTYINANLIEYKNSFSKVQWGSLSLKLEDIKIPVIGFLYNKTQMEDMAQLSIALQHILGRNQYNGVLLSTGIECDIENNVFHIDEEEIEADIVKFIQIASSDIILLHIPEEVFFHCPEDNFMDLIVGLKDNKYVYLEKEKSISICGGMETSEILAQHIFNKIEEIFE